MVSGLAELAEEGERPDSGEAWADVGVASRGAAGPKCTPASLGHTTPITNPAAATSPTLIQGGRSAAAFGTSIEGCATLRTFIAPQVPHRFHSGENPAKIRLVRTEVSPNRYPSLRVAS